MEAKIKKTMSKAIDNVAQKYGADFTATRIFINTIDDDFTPSYFAVIEGKPITTENGEYDYLHFNNDILGIKMDLMAREFMVGNFIKNYLKIACEVENIEKQNVFVSISKKTATDIELALYNGGKFVKRISKEELF